MNDKTVEDAAKTFTTAWDKVSEQAREAVLEWGKEEAERRERYNPQNPPLGVADPQGEMWEKAKKELLPYAKELIEVADAYGKLVDQLSRKAERRAAGEWAPSATALTAFAVFVMCAVKNPRNILGCGQGVTAATVTGVLLQEITRFML